jgi:hypothetical protein
MRGVMIQNPPNGNFEQVFAVDTAIQLSITGLALVYAAAGLLARAILASYMTGGLGSVDSTQLLADASRGSLAPLSARNAGLAQLVEPRHSFSPDLRNQLIVECHANDYRNREESFGGWAQDICGLRAGRSSGQISDIAAGRTFTSKLVLTPPRPTQASGTSFAASKAPGPGLAWGGSFSLSVISQT